MSSVQGAQFEVVLSFAFGFRSRWQSERYLPSSFIWCVDMMRPYSFSMRRLLRFSDRAVLKWWYAGHSVKACSSVSNMRSSQKGRFRKIVIVPSLLLQQNLHSLQAGSA